MNIHISNDCYLTNWSEVADEDAGDLVKHMRDKEIYDNTLMIPYPYTEDHATTYIKRHENSKYDFAIRSNLGYLIGCIGIRIDAVQPHKAILGYWLAKPYWGQGIMTRVVRKFTQLSFEIFELERISASCFEHNIGSARVLEKAGFKLEGLMIKHYKKDGQVYNGKLYGIVR